MALDLVPLLLAFIAPFLPAASPGLFVVEETAATPVAVTEIGASGAAQAAEVASSRVVTPGMIRLADFLLTDMPQAAAFATEYRAAQTAGRAAWSSEFLRQAVMDQMINASTNLGVWVAESFAEAPLGSKGLGLARTQRVCCDGAQRGGAAARKFDSVYLVRDAQGNVEKVVILEAKGGKRYVNPLSRWGVGRKVLTEAGEELYALQGTRLYIADVARVMSQSSDPAVNAAGIAIRDKVDAELWSKIEYDVATSKLAGQSGRRGIGRGLAWGVARTVTVFRAVL
jgi:hypothetical protein